VRQHFIQYLKNEKGFSLSTMAVEKGLSLYGLKKRADIVCYGKQGQALVIVECKAPDIRLNNDTFAQAANYNHQLRVPYLIITNGMEHYCAVIDLEKGSYTFLKSIPDFPSISG
jgi:type I site-specific restriction endonuclease